LSIINNKQINIMKNLILNNGKFWSASFIVNGLNIPNFGDQSFAKRFDNVNDAQEVINNIPKNIANDCKIVRDIFNI